jgi:hypothetical protein
MFGLLYKILTLNPVNILHVDVSLSLDCVDGFSKSLHVTGCNAGH